MRILARKRKKYPGTPGYQDFPGFSILRYVCVFSIGFGAFSVIVLHFLQKYRCVPQIGFPDAYTHCIDISIDILTDKEEVGGRRKEGRKEWASS